MLCTEALKVCIVLPPYLGITSFPTQKHHRTVFIRRDLQRSPSPTPCSKKNQLSVWNTGESIHTKTTLLQSTHKKRSRKSLTWRNANRLLGTWLFLLGMEQPMHRNDQETTNLFLWSMGRPTRIQLVDIHQQTHFSATNIPSTALESHEHICVQIVWNES